MNERRDVIEIDLSEILSTRELHVKLSHNLGFPDFYGQNWDAFWDSITGLVEMPKQLRFRGYQKFTERFPHEAQMLQQCLDNMVQEYPEWASKVEYF